MLLRTLEVPDAQGQLLNAVLLCGFKASVIDRQFLVYSLNEKLPDDLVKIYLAPLEGDRLKLSMCSVSPEVLVTATAVLKAIIRDACNPSIQQTDAAYTVMDLTDLEIQCTSVQTHHSLKISETWLMKLLALNPEASKGLTVQVNSQPPLEASQTQIDVEIKQTTYLAQSFFNRTETALTLPYRVLSSEPAAEETLDDGAEKTAHVPTHSEKIETNLKSLIASVTQHKETLLSKFVKLDERLSELEKREQALNLREHLLIGREDELITGIQALQTAEEQLRVLMSDA